MRDWREPARARQYLERALQCQQAALDGTPGHPQYREFLAKHRQNLIRLLATCPDPACRAPGRAVELARKAVARPAPDAGDWSVLGTAECVAGNWQEAIAAFEQVAALGKEVPFEDGFFLARASCHRGERDQARLY